MICKTCDKEFISVQWYVEETGIPMCDSCLVSILRARKDIKQREIDSINRHIENLEKRIEEELYDEFYNGSMEEL